MVDYTFFFVFFFATSLLPNSVTEYQVQLEERDRKMPLVTVKHQGDDTWILHVEGEEDLTIHVSENRFVNAPKIFNKKLDMEEVYQLKKIRRWHKVKKIKPKTETEEKILIKRRRKGFTFSQKKGSLSRVGKVEVSWK